MATPSRTLWAVSDLHVNFPDNRATVDALRPRSPGDWLIVAGDVADSVPDVVRTMRALRGRFDTVIWVPGNHELYSRRGDRLKGKAKYRELVGHMRALGVSTPEDPFPIFGGVTVCPLFTLYDYSFRPLGLSASQAVARATVRLDDELTIAPYVDVIEWCRERVEYTAARLTGTSGPTILVNHWPLIEEPTRRLMQRDLALWCGTRETRMWPVKYQALAVIHGHLHIPLITSQDGIPHIEVSLGYPFERQRAAGRPTLAGRQWPYPVVVEQ